MRKYTYPTEIFLFYFGNRVQDGWYIQWSENIVLYYQPICYQSKNTSIPDLFFGCSWCNSPIQIPKRPVKGPWKRNRFKQLVLQTDIKKLYANERRTLTGKGGCGAMDGGASDTWVLGQTKQATMSAKTLFLLFATLKLCNFWFLPYNNNIIVIKNFCLLKKFYLPKPM